jgi:hypothetical protein
MYCRLAGTDSNGVAYELAPNGTPGSLENVSACWATRFVASTRAPKAAIDGWRFLCSESSDNAARESRSQLLCSAMDIDSSRNHFCIADPAKRSSHVLPTANLT